MEHRVVCDRCSTEHKIPDARLKGKPARFHCKGCRQEIFLVPGEDDLEVSGGFIRSPFEAVVPKQLGNFKDLKRLASGGMGDIFLAKQSGVEGFEKQVVLKVLHSHLARDRNFAQAMVDEAKITVALQHPNIVQMMNLERAGELLYCVMEYVPGQSLATVLRTYRRKGGRVPMGMAIYIIAEALEGLHYAHDLKDADGQPLGIVHRDISPHNIMVSKDGWVKVIDFGIAKAASRITETQPGTIKGKFAYMAPEHLKGKSDHRADIFAMGVVLWETLSGARLFYSNTDVDTLQKVLHLEAPPIRQSRPDVPEEMERILDKALEKDQTKRYQTAREFKTDLAKLIVPRSIQELRDLVDLEADCLGEGQEIARSDSVDPDAATPVSQLSLEVPMAQHPERRAARRLRRVAGLAILGLVLIGGAAALYFGLLAGQDQVAQADAGPLDGAVAAVGPVADAGPTDAGSVDKGADAGAMAAGVDGAAADQAAAGASDAGPVDAGTIVAVRPPPKPIKLTRGMIQKQLMRSGGRLQACADASLIKAGLGNNVSLVLKFSIAQSGRVSSLSLDPVALESSQFGRCLMQRVKKIRFPRQVDKSVTVSFPLQFKAVGGA